MSHSAVTPGEGAVLKRIVLCWLAGVALLSTAWYAPELKLQDTAWFSALEQSGWWVFRREGCHSCHLLTDSSGRRGPIPDLKETPKRRRDWYLAYLLEPRAVLPRSPMPSYALSTHDFTALVAFLARVNKASIPARGSSSDVIPSTGDDVSTYRQGRWVYGAYCAGCHGESGNGGGRVGHLLSPEPRDFTDAVWMNKQPESYLFSVISDGKSATAMPAFQETLSSLERARVLRYLEAFADPVRKSRMDVGFVTPK